MNFCVWVVKPDGYVHSECFREVADTLEASLKDLGHDVQQYWGAYHSTVAIRDVKTIILAPHLLDGPVSPNFILFNMEQIEEGSSWVKPHYINLLKQHEVWDYSQVNIYNLQLFGVKARFCPIGYHPILERITPQTADFDVLFVGSVNQRRFNILKVLSYHGLEVKTCFGDYGAVRDDLIARAKIVLNIHYYESKIFEIVRCSYLLANKKFIISETGEDTDMEEPLRTGIVFRPYDKIAEACLDCRCKADIRQEIALKGYEIFKSMPMTETLRGLL